MSERPDAVIIGCGMSGLAAGIRLAHFGKKTVILERHSREGGLNSWYERKGLTLESGLHAMTNFVPAGGSKHAPLMKLLRQLRIPYADLALREALGCSVDFPGASLRFSNDSAVIFSEVERLFPQSRDGFSRLWKQIESFEDAQLLPGASLSARAILERLLPDAPLREMVLCPLSFYGSALPHDMDFRQFATMFKAVFMEGFCRPGGGIRALLNLLLERFETSGGELQKGVSAEQITPCSDGFELRLSTGKTLRCAQVLSNAGWNETAALLNPELMPRKRDGMLGFMEYLAVTADENSPGCGETIRFFSETEHFNYAPPQDAFDLRSGVICFPHRFGFEAGDLIPPPTVRCTALANPGFWLGAEPETYAEAKKRYTHSVEMLLKNHCGTRLEKVLFRDIFTPATVKRYTGHANGAVYGTPDKQYDGKTPVKDLFVCGTDQGFLGISGAMLSGISVANSYLLKS